MKTYKRACISASLTLVLLAHTPLANSATGGVINFRGTIIEGACTVDHSQRTVDVECYRNGKKIHTVASINASDISFPQGKVTGIKWLNIDHTLGIMNIAYQ